MIGRCLDKAVLIKCRSHQSRLLVIRSWNVGEPFCVVLTDGAAQCSLSQKYVQYV